MLRWIEGFDANTDDEGAGFTARYAAATLPGSLSFVSGREEAFAYSATPDPLSLTTPVFPDHSTWIVGMAIAGQDPEDARNLIEFRLDGDHQLALRLSSDDDENLVFEVVRGATVLDTYTLMSSHDFTYIEFKAIIHETDGAYELRVGEITVLEADTVNTADTGAGDADQVKFTFETDSFNDFLYVDDIYVLDGSGTENVDFLGESVVEEGVAVVQGTNDEWTPRTENDIALDMIDDRFTHDGDDGYIVPDDINLTQTFRFSAPDIIQEIYGVQLEAVAAVEADDLRLKFIALVEGNETASTNRTVDSIHPVYESVQETYELNPETDLPWTAADLVEAEFGIRSAA